MSRTYRKVVKCGICTGSNTEYYRDRNRKARQMNRHNLRNLMANNEIEDVNDKVMSFTLPHDSWDEPTDGTFLVSKKSRDIYVNEDSIYGNKNETGIHYWNRKFGKYLKTKTKRH